MLPIQAERMVRMKGSAGSSPLFDPLVTGSLLLFTFELRILIGQLQRAHTHTHTHKHVAKDLRFAGQCSIEPANQI